MNFYHEISVSYVIKTRRECHVDGAVIFYPKRVETVLLCMKKMERRTLVLVSVLVSLVSLTTGQGLLSITQHPRDTHVAPGGTVSFPNSLKGVTLNTPQMPCSDLFPHIFICRQASPVATLCHPPWRPGA